MILNIMTREATPSLAIEELSYKIKEVGVEPALTVLFVSPEFNILELESSLATKKIQGEVMACTTCGEISALGMSENSIVGQVYFSDEFMAKNYLIENLNQIVNENNLVRFSGIKDDILQLENSFDEVARSFGILLVDGMSVKEEEVCDFLRKYLHDLPVVGGSAGDNLKFQKTYVYFKGKFHSNVAVLSVLATTRDFEIFKSQHIAASSEKMIITKADPEQRIVYEINGYPAADYYAQTLGLTVEKLNPDIFSHNPLILRVGGESFIRSIQKVGEESSLVFYCAIDNGLPLHLGLHNDLSLANNKISDDLEISLGKFDSCLLFECILRKLEIEKLSESERLKIQHFYQRTNATGFYTYGEQMRNTHINQTITGVAFGKGK